MRNKLEDAMMVAEQAHGNQQYDIYPYTYHLKKVLNIAQELGYEENILIACILHDTLEDTSLSFNDIKKAFGIEVAEIVFCVTDELGRNRAERKDKTYPKIKGNWKALVVKLCDRVANVEQSKEYNPGLFSMYKKEQKNFFASVYNHDHPDDVHRAWDRLETLIQS